MQHQNNFNSVGCDLIVISLVFSKKIVRKEIFGVPKCFLIQKIFWIGISVWSKNIVGPKKIRVKQILGPKIIPGYKNYQVQKFWVRKEFWFNINLLGPKNLSPKIFWLYSVLILKSGYIT